MVIDHCFPLSHHTLPKGDYSALWFIYTLSPQHGAIMSLSSLSLWARHTPHSPCVTSRAAQFTEPAFVHLREPKTKLFELHYFTVMSRKSTDGRKQITVIKESQILNCKFMPRARRVEGLIAGMSKTIPNNRFGVFNPVSVCLNH